MAALALYLVTLSPGVAGGDAGEMQFVPHVLGIAHWTGYPLYTMFGRLWELAIPLGSVAWRMNLLSAVASAAAVALACIAGRRLAGKWAGGLFAALALAVSPLFWNWAIVAGVRSVTVFFALLIITLAMEWASAEQEQRHSADRIFWALAIAYGLSLAHHRTTIFFLPGLFIYVIWTAPALVKRWRLWLPALAVAVLLPLLLYLYIPIRSAMNPPYAITEAHSLRGFLELVFASSFAGGIAEPLTAADMPPRILDAIRQFVAEFTWPLTLLGLAGALVAITRRPKEATLLGIPFMLLAAFTINYSVGGSDLNIVYLLPAYAIYTLWIGAGAQAMIDLLERPRRAGRVLAPIAALLLAAYIILLPARLSWQSIEQQMIAPLDAYRFPLRGEQAGRMVDLSLPHLADGSVLIGDWEQLTPFWYAQLVDGSVSDLVFHYPLGAGWQAWVNEARQAGQRVFLARRADGADSLGFLSAAGPLVELRTAPATAAPDSATPQNTTFGDQLNLQAFNYPGAQPGSRRPGDVVSLALYWSALKGLSANYAVSVRLVDDQGNVVSSVDYANPVLGMYPTSRWQPGEVVGDFYELALPPSAQQGKYHVEIVVYTQEGNGFRNLPVTQGGTEADKLALPVFEVQ